MISRRRLPWFFMLFLVLVTGTLSVVACGDDEEDSAAKAAAEKAKQDRAASTAFIPADAADQPPIAPGAGPYNGPAPTEDPPPPPPPPPNEGGAPKDSGTPETGSE